MIRTTLLLIIIAICTILIGSCSSLGGELFDKVRKVSQNKIAPPGTYWLKDNLYMDQHEITNLNWKEFVFSIDYLNRGGDSTFLAEEMLPRSVLPFYNDSSSADISSLHGSGQNFAFMNTYYHNSIFDDYPVVNITYQQAKDFCKWRTYAVNLYYAEGFGEIIEVLDSVYYDDVKERVLYRLPTKKEWEEAAQAGLDLNKHPLGYERIKDNHDKLKIVLEENSPAHIGEEDTTHKNPHLHIRTVKVNGKKFLPPTRTVFYGHPNIYGLYNMMGNVSELVEEHKIAKGSNWTSEIDDYTIKEDIRYFRPSSWLGFRCICEVLDEDI